MDNDRLHQTPQQIDLRAEQRKVLGASIASLVLCALVLTAGYLLLPRYFQFPAELPERIAFALQADVFVFLWVVLGVRMVSRGRFYSEADNRGSAYAPPSPAIAVKVAFLQNTLEQAVIATGAHVALATLLSGPSLALIPMAVVLFAIGRITFLVGYARGAGSRAFGMATTAVPTAAGYALAVILIISKM